MAFKQTVVRFENENGKRVREIVKHSQPEIREGKLPTGTEFISFVSQHDSTIHFIQKSLVLEIFVEEEDPKYGTFGKIKTLFKN